MVAITATAQAQIEGLERFFAERGRNLATTRMTEAIAMAAVRIDAQAESFPLFPRPYPELAAYGWSWLKQGRYWIAFAPATAGFAVTGVFFETADIPGRASPKRVGP